METSELKPNNFNENVILKQNCKQYLFFLFGQTLSILGSSTVSFIIVLWITYETGSVILLTLSSFFYLIPQIGVTLIAGVISDRFNKKKMIFISDFSQAMVTLLLFLFFSFGSKFIWIILIISALRSVFQSIQIPIVKALIPIMVPQEHLSRMNSLNFFMNSFILLISPLIATLLLSVLSVNKVILLDIITFFIAVIPLVIITIPEVKNKNVKSKKSFFSDLKEGFNLISEIKGFKSLIILAMCNIFIYYPFQVLLPIFISKIHHGDESNLALVISFLNCGILLGAFISFIKKKWNHRLGIILFGLLFFYIVYLFITFAPPGQFLFIGVLLLIGNSVFPLIDSNYYTLMQIKVPKDKIGRIISIDWALSLSITPIATIISGYLADLLGIIFLFFICCLVGILTTIVLWFFSDIRQFNKKFK